MRFATGMHTLQREMRQRSFRRAHRKNGQPPAFTHHQMVGKAVRDTPRVSLTRDVRHFTSASVRSIPGNPHVDERDRFVCQKVTPRPCCSRAGGNGVSSRWTSSFTLRKMGSPSRPPDCRKVAGVEVSTGPGPRPSMAVVCAGWQPGQERYRVWALLGDGESKGPSVGGLCPRPTIAGLPGAPS